MKAFNNFSRELKELIEFHKLTLYAYDETESLLWFWRKNKLSFNKPSEFGHTVIQPKHFATKRSKKKRRRKSLNEIIFVRLISALEVFLVDIVRDAFLQTKEPFKKQDLKFQLSHAEILSIKSTSNFYNKIINKECRTSNLQTWYPLWGKLKLILLNLKSSKIVTVHKHTCSAVLDLIPACFMRWYGERFCW